MPDVLNKEETTFIPGDTKEYMSVPRLNECTKIRLYQPTPNAATSAAMLLASRKADGLAPDNAEKFTTVQDAMSFLEA